MKTGVLFYFIRTHCTFKECQSVRVWHEGSVEGEAADQRIGQHAFLLEDEVYITIQQRFIALSEVKKNGSMMDGGVELYLILP